MINLIVKHKQKELNDHLNSVKQKIENKAAKQKETSQSININGYLVAI